MNFAQYGNKPTLHLTVSLLYILQSIRDPNGRQTFLQVPTQSEVLDIIHYYHDVYIVEHLPQYRKFALNTLGWDYTKDLSKQFTIASILIFFLDQNLS